MRGKVIFEKDENRVASEEPCATLPYQTEEREERRKKNKQLEK